MDNLKSLQNGSDIRGVAIAGVPGEDVALTPETAARIAMAFAQHLGLKAGVPLEKLKIGIGHDSRITALPLKAAVIAGLSALGCSCFDCGLASTPAMYMGTLLEGAAFHGSIMITASHLPYNRNGMKFFTVDGALEKEDIASILQAASALEPPSLRTEVRQAPSNLMALYSAFLKEKIIAAINGGSTPLAGLKIVLDAANGAGGFFAYDVLAPLGADITGSIYLEPDGAFPNHVPNPEDPKAMAAIKKAVLENNADLGIIFDTDVDRAAVVFSDGQEANKNALIALASVIVAQEHPGSVVVTDSVTSDGLTAFLNDLGLIHHRFKRGYKNVINEAIRLNQAGQECWLAIETSGHCALRENHFLDDGAYLSVKIIIEAARLMKEGKKLNHLISGLKEPESWAEARLRIHSKDPLGYAEALFQKFKEYAKAHNFSIDKNNYEGIRISFANGWALMRMSLHDPVIPINIESGQKDGVSRIAEMLLPFFEGKPGLDISSLQNLIQNGGAK